MFKGKRDASPVKSGTPRMRDLLKAVGPGGLPPVPHNFGHGLSFGYSGWRMLGNGPDDTVRPGFQGCGDCAWAGPAHEIMEAAYTSRRPAVEFSGRTVVGQYSSYGGYDPQTGENDNGSDLQEVLSWRQTKGLHDDAGNVYKIGQHVALTPGDLVELWAGTYLFECVGIGVQLQQAQEDAFPGLWDYVKGSPIVGGHYVPVMGNNGLISWGDRVGFTQSFYKNCCDEAYAYVDPERYNTVTGKTAEGFTDQDLEKYVALVTKAG